MKVVLFCGGRGLRMRDGGADVPKPLSVLAGRPLIWHVMNWYAAHGHVDFVLTLGYRGDEVAQCVDQHADPSWRVVAVDTGVDTPIGQRLVRVREQVRDEEVFLANYADLLCAVPLGDMVETFVASDAVVAMLAVRPQESFHLLEMGPAGRVTVVAPVTKAPMWQNGGFFVMRPGVFDVISDGEDLVDEPLNRLADRSQLLAYPWEGFWAPLDTQRDRLRLEELVARRDMPWLPRKDQLSMGLVR